MPYSVVPFSLTWSSSTRFVIACAAAIITLGDFWRLPYLLATYGGGAFLLVYIAALLLLGLPIFSAQIFMARGTRADLPGVIAIWAATPPHSRAWRAGAYIALLGTFLLLAVYTVIASWLLAYGLRALAGDLGMVSITQSSARFAAFVGDGEKGLGWTLLFVLLLVTTAALGLKRGIEPVMSALAGAMAVLLVILLIITLWSTPTGRAWAYLWPVDFTALGLRGFCEALYQVFFSLSLGTGVIMALGSNLPARAPAIQLSAAVIVVSQAVALGLAFILASFVPGGSSQLGTGVQWIFEVLPVAVQPVWVTLLVLLLLVLVAVTSGIGLFEPLVQMLVRRIGLTRLRAAIYTGIGVSVLGLAAQNALGFLASWQLLGRNLFGWLVLVSTHWLLPFAGLMFCVLVGSVLARRRLRRAWSVRDNAGMAAVFSAWHLLLRYPSRIALIVVVAYALGVVDWIEAFWEIRPWPISK